MARGRAELVNEPRGTHASPTSEAPTIRHVFDEHGPFVCRSLRYLGVREPDLDDMLQEVFLVVSRRLGDYDEHGRMRAWLYSICTRVARSYRRKAARVRESLNPSFVEQESEPSQLTQVEDRQALVLGCQLLSLISPEQREVFVLYEVEDMTMPEIAQALSLPLQTGYSRLHRARALILAAVQRITSGDGHG